VFNGKGVLLQENDIIYNGDFVNGVKEGYGILKNKDSSYKYDGNWKNGNKTGFGIYFIFI
jgi:hypothetical protein